MNPTDADVVELPAVAGPDDQEVEGKHLVLGVEKFRRPSKHYKLIWIRGQQAWPASENKTPFRRKGEAVIAGEELAEVHGAKFSYVTR